MLRIMLEEGVRLKAVPPANPQQQTKVTLGASSAPTWLRARGYQAPSSTQRAHSSSDAAPAAPQMSAPAAGRGVAGRRVLRLAPKARLPSMSCAMRAVGRSLGAGSEGKNAAKPPCSAALTHGDAGQARPHHGGQAVAQVVPRGRVAARDVRRVGARPHKRGAARQGRAGQTQGQARLRVHGERRRHTPFMVQPCSSSNSARAPGHHKGPLPLNDLHRFKRGLGHGHAKQGVRVVLEHEPLGPARRHHRQALWGRDANGVAGAGVLGDQSAAVAALAMRPTQQGTKINKNHQKKNASDSAPWC